MQSGIKHVLLKYSRLQMFKDVKLAVFLMHSGIKCIIIKYSTHILYFSWHKMSSFYLQFGILYVFMHIFHIMDVFPLQSGAGLRFNTDSRCFRLQRSLTQSVRDVTCSSLSHSHSCIFSSCSLNVPSLETGNKTSSRRIHKHTSINNTAASEGWDRCTLRHVHAQARARSCNDILTMSERAGRKQEDPPREHRRAR